MPPLPPQKSLSFSLGKNVAKPVAGQMIGRFVKDTRRTAQAISKDIRASAGNAARVRSDTIARRIVGGTFGGTITHKIMRGALGAIRDVDTARREAGGTSLIKASKQPLSHGDLARAERMLGSEVVRTQPKDTGLTTEQKAQNIKRTRAARALEAGESLPGGGTDREKLQQMERGRQQREYAGKVLESAETGKAFAEEAESKNAPASGAPIPFAKDSAIAPIEAI